MTVYVDDMHLRATVGRINARWSHMLADSDEELVAFAVSIGLKAEWIQEPDRPYGAHFDVTDPKRLQAIRAGAVAVSWRSMGDLLAKLRAARGNSRPSDLPDPDSRIIRVPKRRLPHGR